MRAHTKDSSDYYLLSNRARIKCNILCAVHSARQRAGENVYIYDALALTTNKLQIVAAVMRSVYEHVCISYPRAYI